MRCRAALWTVVASVLLAATPGLPLASATSLASEASANTVGWALLGDSITAMYRDVLADEFAAAEVDQPVVVAWAGGMTDRRVQGPHSYVPSGIDDVARVRRVGEPRWWVVELGTNDAMDLQNCECADPMADASARVDRLLAAMGPGARVLWVSVHDEVYPRGAAAFDAALDAHRSPTFVVIDWHALSAPHPEWFLDGRHPTHAGEVALGQAIAAAVAAAPVVPLPDCPTPSPSRVVGPLSGGATAAAPAVRCVS